MIYIREAHPTDGWYMGTHDIHDSTTIEERRQVAHQCENSLQYGIQTYVDEMDDAVMKAYAAWPDRLYLIKDGHIAYVSELGPFGFKPEELKQAIEGMLVVRH